MSGEFPDWVKNKHNEVLIERRLEEARALHGELKRTFAAARKVGALKANPDSTFSPGKFEGVLEAQSEDVKIKLCGREVEISELSYQHPETEEALVAYRLKTDSLLRDRSDLDCEGPLEIILLTDTEGNITDLSDVQAECLVDGEPGGAPTVVLLDAAFALKDINSLPGTEFILRE